MFSPFSAAKQTTNQETHQRSIAAGDTAAESVRNLIKKNTIYSKRVIYDALKSLIAATCLQKPPGRSQETTIRMKTNSTIGMDDDKNDGEATLGVIVEEEPGTAALSPASEPTKATEISGLDDMDAEGEADEGSDDDKDDDIGWEDADEQEV